MSEPRFTPGPWEWTFRSNNSVMLQTPDRGKLVVMDFARKGMNRAEPRFAVMDDDMPRGRRGGILYGAHELYDKCHRKGSFHPDACLMEASPDLYTALQSLADWFGLGHGVSRNNLDQYEHLAAEFYRETGRMRPGKDSAAAANESEDHKAETGRIWREWIAKKEEELIAMVGGALAKARGEV